MSKLHPGASNQLCPACGVEMVQRTNLKSGIGFLGCSQFPKCRGTRSLDIESGSRRGAVSRDDDCSPNLSELAVDWGYDSWEDFDDHRE